MRFVVSFTPLQANSRVDPALAKPLLAQLLAGADVWLVGCGGVLLRTSWHDFGPCPYQRRWDDRHGKAGLHFALHRAAEIRFQQRCVPLCHFELEHSFYMFLHAACIKEKIFAVRVLICLKG